jgi:apolipoprotein N-acyltransferase
LALSEAQVPNKFAVLICFEDLFPELSRRFIKEGADFLVNITNDAWYKRTAAPYQHLQASVFRAVENRVFMVRSANTGISAFINPQGLIISTVRDSLGREIFTPGYITHEIAIEKKPASFYVRYGDIFVTFCFLFSLYGIFLWYRKA